MPTALELLLQTALADHRAGRLADAETHCREILSVAPNHAPALHLLGVLAGQTGNFSAAVQLIRRSLAIEPRDLSSHHNLALALEAAGEFGEAIAADLHALELDPGNADLYFHVAQLFQRTGRLENAIAAYREAVNLRPHFPEAHRRLGNALQLLGDLGGGIAAYREALRSAPNGRQIQFDLAQALQAAAGIDEAIELYRQILATEPGHPETGQNLGNAFFAKGEFEQAIEAYRGVLEFAPTYVACWSNLAAALLAVGQLDEAISACRAAMEIDPGVARAHDDLADVFNGEESEMRKRWRDVRLSSDYSIAHSNLVYTLNFHEASDASAILAEARRWNGRHAEPLAAQIRPHSNDRSPERRVRVGYVSADFRNHVVGWNMLGILAAHDRSRFEIYCYAVVGAPDALTARLRPLADHWREAGGWSDEQIAEAVRRDQIDILVDLALHMGGNRLLVFARKPAPIQVTYLGYCGTTGLDAMDYRLSDPHFDPPDSDLSVYSEKTVRLPRTYWSYEPAGPVPNEAPKSRSRDGCITFGSLNNFAKVVPGALQVWLQILAATPESRLLLYAPEGDSRARVRDCAEQNGIDPGRIEFLNRQPWSDYLRTWEEIDVALDTFPYGGGITTCDALWMGTPIVTLAGATAVSRGGTSILTNLGLPEWIARTPEEYVSIALGLAHDAPKRARLRATLRDCFAKSPLRDPIALTCDVEAAYREMWLSSLRYQVSGLKSAESEC